ncbi:IQ domain-containing protein K [Bombina bombina]|uniref:IQ domain-containing protein K n=1 Tax=Bombina bombina TaxID=8345 RepID=UPI00235A7D61|nr:IQ domain-containing protein K [Bombina bombina]
MKFRAAAMAADGERVIHEYDERKLRSVLAGLKSQEKSIISVKDNQCFIAGDCLAADPFITDYSATELPDPKTCSALQYSQSYIYPVLLPGIEAMLTEAKKERCFQRKRTKFIPLDFLTQWLYNLNPKRNGRPSTDFFEIPFVQEQMRIHPRPPVPLSLLLSDEEAAVIIQSFWRGYRVRCDPEVQELRQWQKDLRMPKVIKKKVQEFWAKKETRGGTKKNNG